MEGLKKAVSHLFVLLENNSVFRFAGELKGKNSALQNSLDSEASSTSIPINKETVSATATATAESTVSTTAGRWSPSVFPATMVNFFFSSFFHVLIWQILLVNRISAIVGRDNSLVYSFSFCPLCLTFSF